MIGYSQIPHEVWVPMKLARKDGTYPRVFCVFNTFQTSRLVNLNGGPLDLRDYEDFVLEWAEQWAEHHIDAVYLSTHHVTKTVSNTTYEIAGAWQKYCTAAGEF